jgi:hypothetical protein
VVDASSGRLPDSSHDNSSANVGATPTLPAAPELLSGFEIAALHRWLIDG